MQIPILPFFALATTVQATLHLKLVTQFPAPFWIENIAVRRNGALLLTQLTTSPPATLYTLPYPWLSISSNSTIPAKPLHTFPNTNALLGLAESPLHPDLFVLVGGVNPTANSSGSFVAWTVDFRPLPPSPGLATSETQPRVTQIASLSSKGVLLPNGVAALPGRNAVLVADSLAGCIWRVDIATGAVQLAVKVPEMAASKGAAGVNGVRVVGEKLYWTNSATAAVYRVGIDAEGKQKEGDMVEKVASLPAIFADDFAVGPTGRKGELGGDLLWVATNVNNTLIAVNGQTGKTEVVAGATGSLELAGPTAAAFGRTEKDKEWLYVVTCGGVKAPVNGLTEGGKVVAVDTRGFAMRD